MKWLVKQIENSEHHTLSFSIEDAIDATLMARENTILAVSPVALSGQLIWQNHTILALCKGTVTVTLPSSRTLEPVPITIPFVIEERYIEAGYEHLVAQYDHEVVTVLDGPTLDLRAAVEDTILLNLPLQVLSVAEATSEQMPSGHGWTVLSEDAYKAQKAEARKQHIDPRMAQLAQLRIDDEEA